MSRRLSRALTLADGENGPTIQCAKCGHALAQGGASWKAGATMQEVPMRGAGGAAYSGGEQVLLRRFSCPNCGSLLDSETAVAGDDYLEDVVDV